MRYEALIQNIIEQVKEAQIKLGYVKETVRLYYPLSTLNMMLDVQAESEEEMLRILREQCVKSSFLGTLIFSAYKQRIEVCVPPEGAEYIHVNVPEPEFLMAMIELFRQNHHCTLEDIRNLFASFSGDYVYHRMPEGSDFDAVFYFKDAKIDAYYYCIKEEMGHTIYHRFTKEDMIELLKE